MIEHIVLAFASAALLSGIGFNRNHRSVVWVEVVAIALAASVLLVALVDALPPLVFLVLWAVSLALNVLVCVLQFVWAKAPQADSPGTS